MWFEVWFELCVTFLCEPTGEGWSDELKLQSIDEDVDEDDLDEDGKKWVHYLKKSIEGFLGER